MRIEVKITPKELAFIRAALVTHECQNEGLFSTSEAAILRCFRRKLELAEENVGALLKSKGSPLVNSSLLQNRGQCNNVNRGKFNSFYIMD